MSDSSLAVQTAIFERLSAALAPTPVYDNVPQDSPPLYVQIGQDTALPSETKSANSSEHTIEIHIYSSKRGFSETKAVMKQIYDELHKQPLVLVGFESTTPLFDFSESFPEPDGTRGVIRFRHQTQ